MSEIINGDMVLNNEANSGLKDQIFNPVKKREGDQTTRVWSSESVALAEEALNNNLELIESPYNTRIKDFNLRAGGLPFKISEDEKKIFQKFKNNKILFGNTVMHLKDEQHGWTKIKLRDYQVDLLNDYTAISQHILMFPRQSGKTTTTIVEIVHFLIYNYDKDVVVIAQSETVVNEILSKIKSAFSKLPFFLQPGFTKFTADEINLDNGCRLKIGIASESTVQGFSLDFLFIDEFAYISDARAHKFWINIYPALVNNPHSKVIIASTPNGRNLFYELWQRAISKQNNFKPSRVYWYDVPRKNKDGSLMKPEEFKAKVIADIGLEGWLMGFECSFDTQLKAIFNTKTQTRIREDQTKYEKSWSTENDYIGTKYGIRFIDKNIINYSLDDYFLLGVDIGEGLEQDASVVKIRKLEINDGKLMFRLVGVYEDNTIPVNQFAELVMNLSRHFTPGKFQISVENNNYGGQFFNQIDNLRQYDKNYNWFDIDCLAKFRRDSKDDYEYGIRQDKSRKKAGVSYYRALINEKIFDDYDYASVDQMMNFGRDKNGTYKAQYGHDDLVMADIAIALAIKANDVFNKEFIEKAEVFLRIEARDFNDERVVKHFADLEKEAKLNKQIIDTPKGMKIRNSRQILNETKLERKMRKQQMRDEEQEFMEERYGSDARYNMLKRRT